MLLVNDDSRRLVRQPRIAPLLVGALLLVAGCGLFEGKSEYEKVQDKRQGLIDLVAGVGGTAKIENHRRVGVSMDGWFIDLSGAELTEELIETMIQYAQNDPVFDLNLSNSSITDEQLKQLDTGKVLQKCFILDLRDTSITDAGLDGLSNFYVIQELKLKGTKVTPAAVKRLGDKQLAQKYTPEPLKKRPETDIESQ
jgi:hypothetical protein